ncbi:MAG: diguanylate cyclase [Nitrospirae bacterium]|nr:diguanylate cyclase [Nitrospirota bacterium]
MPGSQFSAPPAEEKVPTIVFVGGIDQSTFIRALEHEGYRVDTAPPGADVVKGAVEASASLVILDVSPGNGESLEWCRRLKRDQQAHVIPVIALVRQATWEARMAAAQAGADAVFAQTIEIDRMLHKIDELIGGGFEAETPLVLAVDADQGFLDRLSAVLQQTGFRVLACREPEAIFPSLGTSIPDVVVVGAQCKGMTGLDLYAALKRQDGLHHVPAFFVPESPNPAERLVALGLGIDDYVSRADPNELATRIATRVNRTRFFKKVANRDALTGVLNYRAFMDRMHHEIGRASRYDLPFTLVLLDMDGFKQLNDRFGHLAGNRALQELVVFLRRRVRRSDLIARVGGDEFAVLMIEASKDAIGPKWETLRRAFCETPFQLRNDGDPAQLGFSFGMASWPQDGDALELLIASADSELYRQKERLKPAA